MSFQFLVKTFLLGKTHKGYRIGTGICLLLWAKRNTNSGMPKVGYEDATAVESKGVPGLEDLAQEAYLFCKLGLSFPQSSQGYSESQEDHGQGTMAWECMK